MAEAGALLSVAGCSNGSEDECSVVTRHFPTARRCVVRAAEQFEAAVKMHLGEVDEVVIGEAGTSGARSVEMSIMDGHVPRQDLT